MTTNTCIVCNGPNGHGRLRCIVCHNRWVTSFHNDSELGYIGARSRGFTVWGDLSEAQKHAFLSQYEQGEPTADLARHYGVTTETISNWVRYGGGIVRPPGRQVTTMRPIWPQRRWNTTRLVMEKATLCQP